MRSPDLNNQANTKINRDPNGILVRFEESIRPFAERMKLENTPHSQIKNIVRMQCIDNMDYLGLNHKDAQKAAMYFFSLIYENPEDAHIIWENLHELSLLLQNELNKDSGIKILEKVDRLLELNRGGITYLWRLIHSILRGDFEMKEIVIGSEKIYYLEIPDDKKRIEKNIDKNRQKLTAFVKEKLSRKLVEKPLPQLHESIKFFSDHDQKCLIKIIQYLQNDIDLIVFSSEWKGLIQQYFNEIEGFLRQSIPNISLEKNRSGVRKDRYAEYINQILANYLPQLREYCFKMADKKEENLFAADALFEPTLVRFQLLINGTDEPSISVIVKRWKQLMKDIQMIVGDNATRLDMRAFQGPAVSQDNTDVVETEVPGLNPDEFSQETSDVSIPFQHPTLSGELKTVTPPAAIKAYTDSSVKATILGQPVIDAPAPGIADAAPETEKERQKRIKRELLEWTDDTADSVGKEDTGKDNKQAGSARPPFRRNPDIDGTKLGIPVLLTPPGKITPPGVDPLGATVAAKVQEIRTPTLNNANFCGTNHNYLEAFDRLDGTALKQAENERKRLINQEINYLKSKILDGSLDLTDRQQNVLLNKLYYEVFRRYVQTDELRRFFISECCRMFNEINRTRRADTREKEAHGAVREYVYSTLSSLFGSILQSVKMSYDLDQYFSEGKCEIPDNNTLKSLPGLPKLDDYKQLSKTLSDSDPVLSEIRRYSLNAAANLENLSYYIETIVKISEGDRNAFSELQRYYNSLKQEHEQIRSMIQVLKKKISGGFFKKLFGKRKTNSEINEYFEALSEQTEKIWQEGIQPSMNLFGKLILGQHRKQIQSETI